MSSSDTSSASNYNVNETTTIYDQKPGVGSIGNEASSIQSSIGQASVANVTITSESPQALAAAATISQDAIKRATDVAMQAASLGTSSFEASKTLAERSTATASEQGTKFVLVLGGIALALILGAGLMRLLSGKHTKAAAA